MTVMIALSQHVVKWCKQLTIAGEQPRHEGIDNTRHSRVLMIEIMVMPKAPALFNLFRHGAKQIKIIDPHGLADFDIRPIIGADG